MNTLADFSDDRVLVIDDYHGIMSSQIHGDLEFVIREAKASRNTSISPLTANPRLR
jgi:ATP/maltotriose-dependent transcriptional regulator MalT